MKCLNRDYSSLSSYSKKFTRQQFCDRHHEMADPYAIILYQLITDMFCVRTWIYLFPVMAFDQPCKYQPRSMKEWVYELLVVLKI